jgi:hypothetical protein
MCAFPASHFKVQAAIEKGLADEGSVFADYFCSWRHPFPPDGPKDSVAKGMKYFEGLGK